MLRTMLLGLRKYGNHACIYMQVNPFSVQNIKIVLQKSSETFYATYSKVLLLLESRNLAFASACLPHIFY